jgi:hypothetical protein
LTGLDRITDVGVRFRRLDTRMSLAIDVLGDGGKLH